LLKIEGRKRIKELTVKLKNNKIKEKEKERKRLYIYIRA